MTNKKSEMVKIETGEIVDTTGEVSSGIVAGKVAEIQGAIVLANKMPRNIDKIFSNAMAECERRNLAVMAQYEFPRGSTQIKGASIYLARTLGRLFGNIRWGIDVLADDDDFLQIESWAWDIENNTKVVEQDKIKKLVFRKGKGWVVPDERDLRELKNRRGAIGVRNCIYGLLPRDLVDDAIEMCNRTLAKNIKSDKDARKQLIFKFSKINVSVEMLEKYFGIESKDWGDEELVSMHNIINAINDGQATAKQYFSAVQSKVADETSEGADLDDALNGMEEGDGDKRKGYDDKPSGKPKKARGAPKNKPQAQPEPDPEPEDEPEPNKPKKATPDQIGTIATLFEKKKLTKALEKESLAMVENSDNVTYDDAESMIAKLRVRPFNK